MKRAEWRSTYRAAGLGRRYRAAWAFTALALIAATVAFWRIAPGEQRAQTLAVSVPAASTPAALESSSSSPS